MKLYLETNGGLEYEIEVNDNATLHEIKEEVADLLDIPVSDQTIIFNGDILANEDDRSFADIQNGSRLFLDFAHSSEPIHLCIKMPPPYTSFPMKVDAYETVERLKVLIQETVGSHPTMVRMVIRLETGVECPDDATLIECQLALYQDVNVEFRRPPREVALYHKKEELRPLGRGYINLKLNIFKGLWKTSLHARADAYATIAEVKERIMKLEQRSCAIWRVVMWRKDGLELGDGMRLIDCADVSFIPGEGSWKRLKARVEFRRRIHLMVALPEPKPPMFMKDFCFEDTIGRVKVAVHEADGSFPLERMVIRHEDGEELLDHKMLLDCRTSLHTELKLELRP